MFVDGPQRSTDSRLLRIIQPSQTARCGQGCPLEQLYRALTGRYSSNRKFKAGNSCVLSHVIRGLSNRGQAHVMFVFVLYECEKLISVFMFSTYNNQLSCPEIAEFGMRIAAFGERFGRVLTSFPKLDGRRFGRMCSLFQPSVVWRGPVSRISGEYKQVVGLDLTFLCCKTQRSIDMASVNGQTITKPSR